MQSSAPWPWLVVTMALAAWLGPVTDATADGDGHYFGDTVVPQLVGDPPGPLPAKQGVTFINFDGAPVTAGIEDSRTNRSMITQVVDALPGGQYPAYGSGAKRDAVLQAVVADWSPFNVIVTDVRPAAGDYTMCLVGPVHPFGNSVLGIAPVDCRDASTHNNIAFAFHGSSDSHTATKTATTISQEIAHSFGLEHVADGGNIMNPSVVGGDPSFKDQCTSIVGDIVCGEQHADACGSATSQNSYRELLAIFGDGTPDTSAPSVEITSPRDGEQLPEGGKFEIVVAAADDNSVAVVSLYYFGEHLLDDEEEPYGWEAELMRGTHEFYAQATDLAGNTSMSQVITVTVGDGVGGADGGGSGADSGGNDDGGGVATGGGSEQDRGGGCGCRSASDGFGWSALFVMVLALRRRRLALCAAAVLSASGCAVEAEDSGFTSVPTGAGDGDAADTTGEGGDTGDDGADTSTSGTTDDPSTTNPTISTSTTDDPTTGGTGDGAQPDVGMYSHCHDVAECGPVPICLQILDGMGQVIDGICTIGTCSDAAVDCDPAPGGTAVPMCIAVGNESDCVLDCSGGQSCPTNMICFDVGSGDICV